MKLISLLDRVASTPPAPAPRRHLLAQLGRAALAALPAGLAAQPATAAPHDTSLDAVTQLLLLERVQQALYTQALAAPGLIPGAQVADFQRLQRHQTQHEAFLAQALRNAGAVVPALPAFDFSGRRGVLTNPVLFPNALSNYDDFLALAQQLEDLGVRLYQTQAFAIVNDSQLAQAMLRTLPVEARHAAHVRGLRRSRGAVVKNWPSEADAPIVRTGAGLLLTAAATGGEANATQTLTAATPVPFASFLLIRDNTAIHDPALAEAFDEPVSSAAALAALALFS